jgi:ribose transport system substrate-binding protein
MRKHLKTTLIVALALLFAFSAAGVFAAKKKGEEATKEKKESIEKAVKGGGMYPLFEEYKAAAKAGKPFKGSPGKGKKLAFANITATFPFCQSVEKSIIATAKLAGFEDKDMIILDNQLDTTLGLQNADIVLSKKPHGFIEFQIDAKVNAIVGKKFKDAGIPVVAVDIEVPGFPFMGVDNYGAAYQTGEWIIGQIESRLGGIGKVDLIVLGMQKQAGETVMLRSIGTNDALVDKYGDAVKSKIEMEHVGGTAEQSQPVIASILAKHPQAKTIVISCVNDQTTRGAISAVKAVGTLKRENVLYVAQGCDDSGIEMLRNKEIDGDLAYFPEHYGWYIVPAVVAMMQGQPVPPYIFVENEMITPDNVDKWYPKK